MKRNAPNEFAKWVIRKGWLEGCNLDCLDVQDKAIELGLVVLVKYDPDVHGSNDVDAEPGDDWYVLDPWLENPCRLHPGYMGFNRPRVHCEPCWQLWGKQKTHRRGPQS